MRLQKVLADAGYGARRKCELLIEAGRVSINGQIARLGAVVQPGDVVLLDNKPIGAESKVYIALHKPVGYASDLSSSRNRTVFDLVSVPQRLHAVGRLDMDSSGLILLTNDGDLSYFLTHPRYEHEKEYRAIVRGKPHEQTLRRWRKGVLLEGETTATVPCQVTLLETTHSNARLHILRETSTLKIVLHEGRKRQIRRVAKLLGHPVITLERVRIGPLKLAGLESGRWRALTPAEVEQLTTHVHHNRH